MTGTDVYLHRQPAASREDDTGDLKSRSSDGVVGSIVFAPGNAGGNDTCFCDTAGIAALVFLLALAVVCEAAAATRFLWLGSQRIFFLRQLSHALIMRMRWA